MLVLILFLLTKMPCCLLHAPSVEAVEDAGLVDVVEGLEEDVVGRRVSVVENPERLSKFSLTLSTWSLYL